MPFRPQRADRSPRPHTEHRTDPSAIAAALGYQLLGSASGDWVAFIQSFAAGAILTMLADTMIPEAFVAENRSPFTGVVTTLGFALAALLSTL